LQKWSSPSSVLALSVSLPPKLRVTTAETEHMAIYLRTFFRVLSSWVHLSGTDGDRVHIGSSEGRGDP